MVRDEEETSSSCSDRAGREDAVGEEEEEDANSSFELEMSSTEQVPRTVESATVRMTKAARTEAPEQPPLRRRDIRPRPRPWLERRRPREDREPSRSMSSRSPRRQALHLHIHNGEGLQLALGRRPGHHHTSSAAPVGHPGGQLVRQLPQRQMHRAHSSSLVSSY